MTAATMTVDPDRDADHPAAPAPTETRFVVLKFGGSSVSKAGHWQTIAGLIRETIADGRRPFVVHSALVDVSNKLEEVADSADSDRRAELIDSIVEQHVKLANELNIDADAVLSGPIARLRDTSQGCLWLHLIRVSAPTSL